MKRIYIEKDSLNHPRVQAILSRYPNAQHIVCDHYKSVFNPNHQNFRQQKEAGPALILAEKQGDTVLPAPSGFGIGHQHNYYFSHLLNCPYDCRYCFLQGMYPSANWVLFVNYEDFAADIDRTTSTHPDQSCIFFSGYDSDSLALDGLTGFCEFFLPFFRERPGATLELRTKSTQIRSLLKHNPIDNAVVAFSLSPATVADRVEHRTPSLAKRLEAIETLAQAGWQIGLRFDPLIACDTFSQEYRELISYLSTILPTNQVHSVSVGVLRFPVKMLDKMQKLYPKDRLLNFPFKNQSGVSSYGPDLENAMKNEVISLVADWVGNDKIFACEAE